MSGTSAVTHERASTPTRLGPWRLEWLRLVRSPRGIVLVAVYLFFGLMGPVLAKYMSQLLQYVQSNLTITTPPARPVDGIVNYISQTNQTGLIVVVVVAAGALAFDSRRGVSTFLRTRTRSMARLVAPRYVVTVLAAVAAYTVGTLAAWYETTILLGGLAATGIVQGWICGAVYLAFVVAMVAVAASIARSVLATVGIALTTLLVLPLAGAVSAVHPYLPSSLATAPVDLLGTAVLSDYLPTIALTLAATAALLFLALTRLASREI